MPRVGDSAIETQTAPNPRLRHGGKILRMKAFHSGREAKEFLISRIVAEAEHEKVPLSEVERKMLYFTETGWTLPDMAAVSDEFDKDYDDRKSKRLNSSHA